MTQIESTLHHPTTYRLYELRVTTTVQRTSLSHINNKDRSSGKRLSTGVGYTSNGVNTVLAEMTSNDAHGDTSLGTVDIEDQASSPEATSPQQAPLQPYSGLSALLQAATSQLSDLADVAANISPSPPVVADRAVRAHTFPDKLMALCTDPGNSNSITFLPDGKFFAIRRSAFLRKIDTHFDGVITNFDEFLDLAENWGFSVIVDNGIAILRHPLFVAGDYNKCARIQYGESPEAVRMHALPDRARVVVSEDCFQSPKRRLSPGHLARRDFASAISARQKVHECGDGHGIDPAHLPSMERKTSTGTESEISVTTSGATEEDNIRSLALAITTDKLKIKTNHDNDNDPIHLVETAVTAATHEIVADAITSLLRDEGHSKETFFKHEKELSRSSIPGVIPVCKQIFSPSSSNEATKQTNSAPKKSFTKSSPPSRVVTNGSNTVETDGNSKPDAVQLENDSSLRPKPSTALRENTPSLKADVTPPMIQETPRIGGGISPGRDLPAQVLQSNCIASPLSTTPIAASLDTKIKNAPSSSASSSAVAM
jgi:hypothetical protein